ncbi:hypothetical protein AB205_0059520, partial [Aquarana catesbeiana]
TLTEPISVLVLAELKASNTAHFLNFLLNTTDYRILLKDEDHDRMYVGSKDYILSLDLQDINREPLIIHWPAKQQRIDECVLAGKDSIKECGNFIRLIQPWNRTHLYTCGTGAYNPVCTYINRGRKAQASEHMALSGGRGSRAADFPPSPAPAELKDYVFYLDPDRVESGKGKCAYDPKLDSVSALINEELYSGVYIDFMGTDAAIFRAMGKKAAMRTDQYNSRWLNDPAFVHVQLIPDSAERNDDKLYFFFREKSTDAPHSPTIHSRIGRVCLCPGGTFTPSMKSTKDYPDEVINFMRTHPVMYNPVYPVHRQPLLVRTNVNYRFTTIAVDQVDAADGRYEVLFLGTGNFFVHSTVIIRLYKAPSSSGQYNQGASSPSCIFDVLTKIQKIIKNIYTFPFRQIHLFIYTNHIYTFCIPKNNIAGYTAKNI